MVRLEESGPGSIFKQWSASSKTHHRPSFTNLTNIWPRWSTSGPVAHPCGRGANKEEHVTTAQPFLTRLGCAANANNVFGSRRKHPRRAADSHVHSSTLTLQISENNRWGRFHARVKRTRRGFVRTLRAGSREVQGRQSVTGTSWHHVNSLHALSGNRGNKWDRANSASVFNLAQEINQIRTYNQINQNDNNHCYNSNCLFST